MCEDPPPHEGDELSRVFPRGRWCVCLRLGVADRRLLGGDVESGWTSRTGLGVPLSLRRGRKSFFSVPSKARLHDLVEPVESESAPCSLGGKRHGRDLALGVDLEEPKRTSLRFRGRRRHDPGARPFDSGAVGEEQPDSGRAFRRRARREGVGRPVRREVRSDRAAAAAD